MTDALTDLRKFITIANEARAELWLNLIVDTKTLLTMMVSTPNDYSLLREVQHNIAQLSLLATPLNMEAALNAEVATPL